MFLFDFLLPVSRCIFTILTRQLLTMHSGKLLPAITGFLILFGLYHGAEYMILFKNSAGGFLAFHAVFILAAWLIARWQFKSNLSAWGFLLNKRMWWQLPAGIATGILLYGITLFICLQTGVEKILEVPPFKTISGALGLFIFGNFFSSFSEDVLIRGYVYKHLNGKLMPVLLVLFSAALYVLNHIYRLLDGWETYTYLFLLGILLMIPLVRTRQIWLTGAIHWAGNCTFFYTHEIIKTGSGNTLLTPNMVFSMVMLLFIVVLLLVPLGKPRPAPVPGA